MSQPLRVLLVEDSEADALLLLRELRQGGYEPVWTRVTNAAELTTALAAQDWDLVLCDYQLPQFDGLTALRQVRARELDIPFILVSGAFSEEAAVAAMKASAHDYLLKNNLARLLPAVERELREAEVRRQRRRAEEELRQQREWLRVTLTSIGDAVITCDTAGRITFLNPVAASLTGWKPKDVLQQPITSVLKIIDEQTHLPAENMVAKVLQEKRIITLAHPISLVAKDGAQKLIEANAAPIIDSAGNVAGVVLVFHDVTEKRRAQIALQDANHTLRALNQTLEQRVAERTAQLRALAMRLTRAEENERRRVAGVLHEGLQQLLAGAKFTLQSLQGQSKDEAFQARLKEVKAILDESLQVSYSLTYDLSPPILLQEDLAAAIQWLGRWYQEKHGLMVQVEASQPVEIAQEEIRVALFRAVRELLFNVVQHARVNCARATVHRTQAGVVRIRVCDEGVGFDPAIIRARDGVSSGYGLFHLQERLKALGGHLMIDSAPNQGSHIEFWVPPSTASGKTTSTIAPAMERPSKSNSDLPKIRILLADDHQIIRDGLALTFQEEADFEVIGQAADGQEALALARSLQPDVVVMDVSMPHLNGIEATRLLRAELPKTQVIGLSMFEENNFGAAMCAAGAAAYLNKIGPTSDLVAAIRNCVGRRPDVPGKRKQAA